MNTQKSCKIFYNMQDNDQINGNMSKILKIWKNFAEIY